MKIRINYVSNSSSSSFICEVCGGMESGYDLCEEDAGMTHCEHYHRFCNEHKLEFKETVESIKEYFKRNHSKIYLTEIKKDSLEKFYITDFNNIEEIDNNEEFSWIMKFYDDISNYDIGCDYHFCPICNFDVLMPDELNLYLYKKYKSNIDEIKNEIKSKFKTYDDFIDYLNSPD